MNAPFLRRAALSALALLPLMTRAAAAAEFDDLLRSGFGEVRAAGANAGTPAPTAAAVPTAPFVPGGVFLHSWLDGRLAYCSRSGCRVLFDSGVGNIVPAAPGTLYFTGTVGTGYCTESGCRVLLPGANLTFPLTAGPDGDIYGSDDKAGWHCTPQACRQASRQPLREPYTNYLNGLYKPGGFVSSSSAGTFWCAGDSCARVGSDNLLFIENGCAGTASPRVVYAFVGQSIKRCTPEACREIGGAEGVDNFFRCAFDEKGGLLLTVRGASEASASILCTENSVSRTSRPFPSVPDWKPAPARSSNADLKGGDGATYRLTDRNSSGAPAKADGERVNGEVTRADAAGAAALKSDMPVSCWQWVVGDDEDQPGWDNHCRLFR